jgi:hypothetical protein
MYVSACVDERESERNVLIPRKKVADSSSRIQNRFLDNLRTLQRGHKKPLR